MAVLRELLISLLLSCSGVPDEPPFLPLPSTTLTPSPSPSPSPASSSYPSFLCVVIALVSNLVEQHNIDGWWMKYRIDRISTPLTASDVTSTFSVSASLSLLPLGLICLKISVSALWLSSLFPSLPFPSAAAAAAAAVEISLHPSVITPTPTLTHTLALTVRFTRCSAWAISTVHIPHTLSASTLSSSIKLPTPPKNPVIWSVAPDSAVTSARMSDSTSIWSPVTSLDRVILLVLFTFPALSFSLPLSFSPSLSLSFSLPSSFSPSFSLSFSLTSSLPFFPPLFSPFFLPLSLRLRVKSCSLQHRARSKWIPLYLRPTATQHVRGVDHSQTQKRL